MVSSTFQFTQSAPISILSPLVTRISVQTSECHVLSNTNTYLIGRGKSRVLLSTGNENPDYFNLLADYAELVGFELSSIILTNYPENRANTVQLIAKYSWLGCPNIYIDDSKSTPVNSLAQANAFKKQQNTYYKESSHLGDNQLASTVAIIDKGDSLLFDGFKLTYLRGLDQTMFCLESDSEQAIISCDTYNVRNSINVNGNVNRCLFNSIKATFFAKAIRVYPMHGNVVKYGLESLIPDLEHQTAQEMKFAGCELVGVTSQYAVENIKNFTKQHRADERFDGFQVAKL